MGDDKFLNFSDAKKKLKLWLLFFLLLFGSALATLIYFTYMQLETDALLKTTESVDEMVYDIEEIFTTNMNNEAKRGFQEYSHFNMRTQSQKLFYKYHMTGDIERYQPGFIGYFQINPGGVFLSPVYVPPSLNDENYRLDKQRKRKKMYMNLVRSLARFRPLQKERVKSSKKKKRRITLSPALKKIRRAARISRGMEDLAFSSKSRKTKKSFSKDELLSFKKEDIASKIFKKRSRSRPEKGSFTLVLSEDGNLIAYREVVKNNKRYLQGFLVDFETYFTRLVKNIVMKRYLATYSSFNLEFGNELLMRIGQKKKTARYYIERPLSFIQQGLKLNTIINRVPSSRSSRFFYFLILFIIIVVLITFWGLYRLGLSQIKLARQRTNFVSSVSHELRTPLTSISMYSEMLRSSFVDDPEKRNKYYDFIFFESGRLTRLINNILRLNKISNEQDSVEIVQLTSDDLLELICKKIDLQIQRSGFELNVSKGESCLLEVDEDCFTQIFINVVDNAIKFSKESQPQKIELAFEKRNNQAIFSVRDYGPGIRPEERLKVFDLFYRMEDEFTRKSTGTGIGLALVKKLADKMGGEITLEFPDQGTKFCLALKLS